MCGNSQNKLKKYYLVLVCLGRIGPRMERRNWCFLETSLTHWTEATVGGLPGGARDRRRTLSQMILPKVEGGAGSRAERSKKGKPLRRRQAGWRTLTPQGGTREPGRCGSAVTGNGGETWPDRKRSRSKARLICPLGSSGSVCPPGPDSRRGSAAPGERRKMGEGSVRALGTRPARPCTLGPDFRAWEVRGSWERVVWETGNRKRNRDVRGGAETREDLQPGEDGGHPHLPPPPQIVQRLQP